MGTFTYQIPQAGQPNSTEDAKVSTALTTLLSWGNGGVDGTNLAAVLAQAAGVNQAGQTVKGATNIAASESRTNVAYGTLTTPDQVTGIVLPTNGLIAVWYQATWQESVSQAARATIFLGANQVLLGGNIAPTTMEAITSTGSNVNQNFPLATFAGGLASGGGTGSATTASTGQVVGLQSWCYSFGGGATNTLTANGGPCYIFAAAGTYTVSVQFKASSGSVTASNRKLWVQAMSFA